MGAIFTAFSSYAQVSMDLVSTYRTGIFDDGAAEIVTFDSTSQTLIFSNASTNEIEFLDFSDPANLTSTAVVNLDMYGGGVNSVSAYNGVVAVAVEADEKQDNGVIAFFDMTGNFISQVTVGALPDMVTFTPDGQKVVVANEGEPSDDYLRDPEGTISVIDVSGGIANITQANVTTADFGGVSIDPDVRIFGPDFVVTFEDDFQEEDTIQFDTVFNNWSVFNKAGATRTWGEYEFPSGSAELYARISGFDGGCQNQEDYIVSNNFTLGDFTNAGMEFSSAYNFSGDSLELLISTDYVEGNDIYSATWDTITSLANWPTTGGYTWTQSGLVDLSAYVGNENVSVAFMYTANTSDCRTYQFDSVVVVGAYVNAVEQNLEPEYVAVSKNSEVAYVCLQENNGLAIVDLNSGSVDAVVALGFKDHSMPGMGIDPSDRDAGVDIRTIPVYGMYQPDAITYYEVGGQGYVVTANEGDARDYDAYSEEERIKDVNLDPTAFPNANDLQEDDQIGRLNMTTANGDTDGDGDFDELYSYGARSFSIWNATTGALVWDSGEDLETITADQFPDDFNSGNDENDDFEGRSDNKGPEPEAVEVATIGDSVYAFIGLERIGGVMLYNVTDPMNPEFIQYVNNRDFSVQDAAINDVTNDSIGDLGVEDVLYISPSMSNSSNYYVVTANEISGTITVFELTGVSTGVGTEELNANSVWNVYPNPTNGIIRSNKVGDYTVFDLSGKQVGEFLQTQIIDMSEFNSGLYVIKNATGEVKRISKN